MHKIITDAQTAVRQALDHYFRHTVLQDTDLQNRLREFTMAGKHIRGSMTCVGYTLFQREHTFPAPCLSAAVAMELLQSFLLIHDDIMDNDTYRRGKVSIHSQYAQRADKEYGVAMGICAGDIVSFLALSHLASMDMSAEIRCSLIKMVTREIARVGYAQMQDIHNTVLYEPSDKEILDMYTCKAGRYTFSLPFALGARIADAEVQQCVLLENLGEHMGRIFQMRDDYLELFSDEEKTGKSATSDIRENKKTIIRYLLFQHLEKNDAARTYFGKKDIGYKELAHVRQKLVETGVIHKLEQRIQREAVQAERIINELSITQQGAEVLHTLLEYNIHRQR